MGAVRPPSYAANYPSRQAQLFMLSPEANALNPSKLQLFATVIHGFTGTLRAVARDRKVERERAGPAGASSESTRPPARSLRG